MEALEIRSRLKAEDSHRFGKGVVAGVGDLEGQGVVEVQVGAFGVVVGHVDLLVGEEQALVLLVPVLPLFHQRGYLAHGRLKVALVPRGQHFEEGHRYQQDVGYLLEPRVRGEGGRSLHHIWAH